MAEAGGYLKEFLVGIGFKIDSNEIEKFTKTLSGVTRTVTNVGLAAVSAAATTVAFVGKMSVGLEDLYWASKRIGTSVTNIKGYEYAIANLGGTAEGARSMLEGLAAAIRSNPGTEALLGSLGVATRNQKTGALLDMTRILLQLGQKLNDMPFPIAKRYAEQLGVYTSDADLLALEKGPGKGVEELAGWYKRLGVDTKKVTDDSHEFMNNLRLTEGIVEAIATKVQGPLVHALNQAVISTNKWLTADKNHWGFIQSLEASKKVGSFLMNAIGYSSQDSKPANDNSSVAPGSRRDLKGTGTKAIGARAQAYDFFRRLGWSAQQAAGIVSNLISESGMNPRLSGDFGTAWGLAQWRGSRQEDFRKKFGHDIHGSSFMEQLQFIQYELTQGKYRNVGDALHKLATAYEAGSLLSSQYERPALVEENKLRRGQLAERVLIQQTNHITVNGGARSDEVERFKEALANSNNELLRNTKGAVR